MKSITRAVYPLTLTLIFSVYGEQQSDTVSITIEPKWSNLEKAADRSKRFGGKWVVAGSITFKNRAKDTTRLKRLVLTWHGSPVESLCASLYRKEATKAFVPIERYLICDGSWNKQKQTLTLEFNKALRLGPVEKFYLVLTVPRELESILQGGRFELSKQSIPQPFRSYLKHEPCALTMRVQ